MKRAWSVLAILPLTVACAAVLGLEEAELDEEVAGSGGRSASGGASTSAGAGRGGRAGTAGAAACSYEGAGACLDECFNGACCAEARACFELPACSNYVDCQDACQDAACVADCAEEFPVGQNRFNDLVLCSLGCGCIDNEPGEGGAGGSGAVGGRSGAGGRAAGGSGGRATGGSAGAQGGSPACDETTPTTCPSSSSVRYCDGGTLRTVTCQRRCADVGFTTGTGECTGGICQCGDPVDLECRDGALAYCSCYGPCTNEDLNYLYVSCYLEDPMIEPVLRCTAPFAESTPVDCEALALACEPE